METKNIFISHIHEDDSGLSKLKRLLAENGMAVRDYSVNADNPNNAHSEDYIKTQILAPRIRQSSTLVVYISERTKESPYVEWEIEYAQNNDKRIVGVWAHGESECEIPEALGKFADAVVGWTGNQLVDAINGDIDRWEDPGGVQRNPREIKRYSCA